MRAKDFIIEAEVKPYQFEVPSPKRAHQVLTDYCAEARAMLEYPIWRGMSNHWDDDIVIINPSSGKRKSENTSNHYTVILDSSPYLKGWPKRSRSIICSTGSRARDYGDMYAIFPTDGTKIAVCPERDIWETDIKIPEFKVSWTNSANNMYRFNQWLISIGITKPHQFGSAESIPAVRRLCEQHKVDPERFKDIVYKALSPQSTGFRLLSVTEFAAERNGGGLDNQEVWISGPVVAIIQDVWKDMYESASGK